MQCAYIYKKLRLLPRAINFKLVAITRASGAGREIRAECVYNWISPLIESEKRGESEFTWVKGDGGEGGALGRDFGEAGGVGEHQVRTQTRLQLGRSGAALVVAEHGLGQRRTIRTPWKQKWKKHL